MEEYPGGDQRRAQQIKYWGSNVSKNNLETNEQGVIRVCRTHRHLVRFQTYDRKHDSFHVTSCEKVACLSMIHDRPEDFVQERHLLEEFREASS